MMNSLWIAKTGMTAQQTQLDVISHNLANVSTTGFKRNRAEFQDLIYQNLRQVGAQTTEGNQLPTGLHLGLGVNVVATSRNFTQGGLQQSGNNLDVAINGDGFFEITLPDGTTGYTRDGSFQLDAQGRIVTSGGLPVAPGITVPAGTKSISISENGEVSAIVAGSVAPQPLGSLSMSSFVNSAGLQPVGQNMFKESAASGAPQQGTPGTNGLGIVRQGFLETSNVNVVEELVNMIQTQRAYEMNSKAIQTSDQMLAKLSQMCRAPPRTPSRARWAAPPSPCSPRAAPASTRHRPWTCCPPHCHPWPPCPGQPALPRAACFMPPAFGPRSKTSAPA